MSSENPAQRLQDILENIDAIQAFLGDADFAKFTNDRKTLYAVTRALEIISEASRRLPEELKGRHPKIDWLAVAAAGNVYRHEYESVDEVQLWYTVQRELAGLRAAVISELKQSAGQ
jgi:uncharacterized protein with HEPN domain